MRFLRRSLLLLAALLTQAPALAGQAFLSVSGPPALTQYAVDQWDDRQGLPQNSVQAIAQTRDGYLWIGTQSGLVRFDGVRFTTFGRNSMPALPRPYIWALAADPDGSLWIGTEEAGLVRMSGGRFTTFGPAQGLPSPWVSAIHRDRAGTLWVGTLGGGLAAMRDGRLRALGTGPGTPGKSIFALREDAAGVVWVASERGLSRAEGGRVTTVDAPGLGAVHAIAAARDGGLWLVTKAGLVHWQEGRVTRTYSAAQGVPEGPVGDVWEDAQGSVWIASNGGLARLSAGRIAVMPAERLPRAGTQALFGDREGGLWVGTSGAGLARVREPAIVPFGAPEGLTSDAVYPLMQARDGALWVGTSDAGVARVSPHGVQRFDASTGALASDFVFSLAQDSAGAVWVGTLGGLSRIDPGGRATRYGTAQGLAGTPVRAILPTRSGELWLATSAGVQRFLPGPPVTYGKGHGLPDDFATTFFEDRDGSLWIGTRKGVTHLSGGRFRTYTRADGLPDAVVTVIHRTGDGTLWVGTGGGIARAVGSRFQSFDLSDGLCDEEVNWMVEDRGGRLWMSANRGIYALSRAEVDAYAAHRTARLPCALYGRPEGMRSRETNGAVNPAGGLTREGNVIFPTVGGLVAFDPDRLRADRAGPPVAIEEVAADGKPLATPGRVPAGTQQLEVHFTGLSFHGSDRLQFRYRLAGHDNGWLDAGTRRSAFYTDLAPGRYRFQVAARHPNGAWGVAGPELALEVEPLVYQTTWFRVGAALLLVLAAAGVYRWRIRLLIARQRALVGLVEERTRAEARFRDLFDNASDAVFTTDLGGRLTALNRKAQELTGYGPGEAVGVPLSALLDGGEDGARTADAWLAGTAEGVLTELVARDGRRVPVEVSTRPVQEDGAPSGTQAIARDVRERAALEQQLRQSQKMEAVGQLAGGVAHDFNNLLTVIRGGSELVRTELEEGSEARHDLDMVIAAADRAGGLTRQLLAFSRKQIVQPRVVDLDALVQNLVPMLRRLIGEHVAIASVPSAEPAWVMADPGQVEQVLVNLAVNARDAMPDGGMLTLRTGVARSAGASGGGCQVRLSVTDTGQGMDEETQAHIFEPFFTTKEPGKGTGLGLSTVYGIVQQAGGTVRCISTPGEGTTFQLDFPCAAAEPEEAGGAGNAQPVEPGHETVLLVEDDASVRDLAARILRRAGHTVIVAAGGAEALRASGEFRGFVDLLVTDVVMPGMNGRELAEALVARRPQTRVLYMSGYTDDELVRRGALDGGGRGFLPKPFTVESLTAAVRQVLDTPVERRDEPWQGQAASHATPVR